MMRPSSRVQLDIAVCIASSQSVPSFANKRPDSNAAYNIEMYHGVAELHEAKVETDLCLASQIVSICVKHLLAHLLSISEITRT